MYDPKNKKFTLVDTCFPTHHLQFLRKMPTTRCGPAQAVPAASVVGWLNTKMFEETGDEAEVARLDAAHSRHQRQRQARRICRAQPAGRSRQGQAHRGGVLRVSP